VAALSDKPYFFEKHGATHRRGRKIEFIRTRPASHPVLLWLSRLAGLGKACGLGQRVAWIERNEIRATLARSLNEAVVMFKLEVRKELIKNAPPDEGGIWVEKESLVRDDGVRLDIIGTGREFQNFIRYTDRDISFEFTARRYDDNLDPTDTWVVSLGPALERYSRSSSSAITPDMARAIASNIREALMAWPRHPSEPAIKQVKFMMKLLPLWKPAWGDWL
jgi:hypothetical protein